MRQTSLTHLTLLVALLLGACGASSTGEKSGTNDTIQAPKLTAPPAILSTPAEKASYMVNHIFDGVESIDTTMFADATLREQWLVDLFGIGASATPEAQRQSASTYFRLATTAMDNIALEFIERYFGHPNSPIFDERTYILLMEEADQQGLITEAEKVRLADRKLLFSRNQVGNKAEDFGYTLANGSERTLHKSFKGKEILLVFYNPECGTCKQVLNYLATSPTIRQQVEKGLQVLCIYADQNEEEWRNNLDKIPAFATAGMNADRSILDESLYDLKAIPTMYLLDTERKVILKDAFPETLEQYFTAK